MGACNVLSRRFHSIALRIPIASLFESSAQAHELVHLHNVGDFPQAELDSEINVRFLKSKHGYLFFVLHDFGVQIILFKSRI